MFRNRNPNLNRNPFYTSRLRLGLGLRLRLGGEWDREGELETGLLSTLLMERRFARGRAGRRIRDGPRVSGVGCRPRPRFHDSRTRTTTRTMTRGSRCRWLRARTNHRQFMERRFARGRAAASRRAAGQWRGLGTPALGVGRRVSGVGCRVADGMPVPCGVCQAGDPVDSPVTWASAPADAAAVARDVSDRADGGCGKARPLRGRREKLKS